MQTIEKTRLWKSTFNRSRQRNTDIERLKVSLSKARQNVSLLVGHISNDLPEYTVHDVTHLDALWETASQIAGEGLTLTPAEAYVFGCAVLLHDAGMCLAAYPGGMKELRSSPEWKEALYLAILRSGVEVTEQALNDPPPELAALATKETLRLRHAKQAEAIATVAWVAAPDEVEYLIEDGDLRRYYGQLIGRIARSHWLNVSELESELPSTINSPAFDNDIGEVDPVLIACLLRCADAAHIDARRAPRFQRIFNSPSGTSELHWRFQGMLGRARAKDGELLYTSGSAFGIKDADAWWLFFSTAQVISSELQGVDALLEARGPRRFECIRVAGATSPEAMARFVRVDGWRPVDARVRVTDALSVVKGLGGKELYGENPYVPFRELLQNAVDAVRARRALESRGADYGQIDIILQKTVDEAWTLKVEDNGIGMSESVLTGALLDFGKSYWRSSEFQMELPGLWSRGFNPIGRFGIGFFSVFMVSERITVRSRRSDAASTAARVLDLTRGAGAYPVLRMPGNDEQLPLAGTVVEAVLNYDIDVDCLVPDGPPGSMATEALYRLAYPSPREDEDEGGVPARKKLSLTNLAQYLSSLSFALDVAVTLEVTDCGKRVWKRHLSQSNGWLSCDGSQIILAGADFALHDPSEDELLAYIDGFLEERCDDHRFVDDEHTTLASLRALGRLITPLRTASGAVVGRAAIDLDGPYSNRGSARHDLQSRLMLSVRGMLVNTSASYVHLPILGILPGRPTTADRRSAVIDLSPETLARWATEQANRDPREANLALASMVMWFGGDPGELPFVLVPAGPEEMHRAVSYSEFRTRIRTLASAEVQFSILDKIEGFPTGPSTLQTEEQFGFRVSCSRNITRRLPRTSVFAYPLTSSGPRGGYAEYSEYMDDFLAFASLQAFERALASAWGSCTPEIQLVTVGAALDRVRIRYTRT